MKQHLPLDPDVFDLAPSGPALTEYDEEHVITYLRLLDANEDGADWRQASRIVLHIDAEREPDRARRAFDTHLERAKWMSDIGWQQLLERTSRTTAVWSRPDVGPRLPQGSSWPHSGHSDPSRRALSCD